MKRFSVSAALVVTAWGFMLALGLWGFLLNLKIVVDVAGTWGGVAAVLLFPFTQILVPLYAVVTRNDWLPMLVIYSGTFGSLALMIGAVVLHEEKKMFSRVAADSMVFASFLVMAIIGYMGGPPSYRYVRGHIASTFAVEDARPVTQASSGR
jgi:hypothetical protein